VAFYSFGDGPIQLKSKHVTNMGWRSDVLHFLRDVDIVVVPNRIAYYDLLPLECAALGKPLVMTAVGGSKDQLDDLPDAVACQDIRAEDLALSIQVAIERLRKDRSWGRRNQEAYKKHFTLAEFARRWDSAIELMVGAK
jgi:glycosyltransferase involved in cell wall biosynthesis